MLFVRICPHCSAVQITSEQRCCFSLWHKHHFLFLSVFFCYSRRCFCQWDKQLGNETVSWEALMLVRGMEACYDTVSSDKCKVFTLFWAGFRDVEPLGHENRHIQSIWIHGMWNKQESNLSIHEEGLHRRITSLHINICHFLPFCRIHTNFNCICTFGTFPRKYKSFSASTFSPVWLFSLPLSTEWRVKNTGDGIRCRTGEESVLMLMQRSDDGAERRAERCSCSHENENTQMSLCSTFVNLVVLCVFLARFAFVDKRTFYIFACVFTV